MEKHDIEFELQRPVPRSIECRGGTWGMVKPFWWVLLPHTWIACVAPYVLLAIYALAFFPDHALGTVQDHHVASGKRSSYNMLRLQFDAGGRTIDANIKASAKDWNSIKDGQQVPVLYTRLLPEFEPRLESSTSGPLFMVAFGTVWVGFWCGLVFAFAYGSVAQPLRSRWLCRYGKPVVGEIVGSIVVSSRSSHSRSSYLKVSYTYPAVNRASGRANETIIARDMSLSARQLQQVKAGDKVTVLYDPNKPTRSIIYTFGDYKAC